MQTIRIKFILSCMFSDGNVFAFRNSNIKVDNVLETKEEVNDKLGQDHEK